MAGMLSEVKINDIDISLTGTKRLYSYRTEESFGTYVQDVCIVCSINIFSDIPDLNSGMSVTIKRGFATSTEQFIFDGFIDRVDKKGNTVEIYAKDKMITLIKSTVSYSYDGVSFPSTESKGSDIARDLIETWGGMSATVVDTGSILIIKKFICNQTDIFSRLQKLAEIYDYQLYYSTDDATVHFEPRGRNRNVNVLYCSGASVNVSTLPTWKFDNTQCINKVLVKGAVQEVQDEEFFSGNNTSEQVFTLAKKPIIVQVWEYVGGNWVLKTPGIDGSTSGSFDYTIDKEAKKIECTTNWTPATASNNVRVDYTNVLPIPVSVQDDASIGKYGEYFTVRQFNDVIDIDDAEKRGVGILNKFKEPFAELSLKPVNLINFNVGELIRVVDSRNNEDRDVVITEITREYPYKGDTLQLGDKEWRTADWGSFTVERIRRLEEELQKDTDLIVQVRYADHDMTAKRLYCRVLQQSVLGEGFILSSIIRGRLGNDVLGDPSLTGLVWGNDIYGIWGEYNWTDGFDTLPEQIRIVWNDNKIVEDFYTTTFKDTDNTTATWGTSGVLTISAGQEARSFTVWENATNITAVTLTATGTTGTSTVYKVCADLTNWEEVISGVQKTLTYPGQQLWYKIENTFGTALITNVEIDVVEDV